NIYSDILSGLMDAYASVISNNLNVVMKRLTTISIVLMMPTLIASFFGMNLEIGTTIFNPMFYIVTVLTILLTGLTTIYFIRKNWF
ncbi:MAG: CorA family divalent cation transporter, partial [Bacteroidales bacterium]|nr:CorA family divalent cation transporter [Bacteroidales bacterium]